MAVRFQRAALARGLACRALATRAGRTDVARRARVSVYARLCFAGRPKLRALPLREDSAWNAQIRRKPQHQVESRQMLTRSGSHRATPSDDFDLAPLRQSGQSWIRRSSPLRGALGGTVVKARTWLALGLMSMGTLAATVGCGSDETTGPGGGLIGAGAGGTSAGGTGAVGRGGSSSGGSSGSGAVASSLGLKCQSDAD